MCMTGQNTHTHLTPFFYTPLFSGWVFGIGIWCSYINYYIHKCVKAIHVFLICQCSSPQKHSERVSIRERSKRGNTHTNTNIVLYVQFRHKFWSVPRIEEFIVFPPSFHCTLITFFLPCFALCSPQEDTVDSIVRACQRNKRYGGGYQ